MRKWTIIGKDEFLSEPYTAAELVRYLTNYTDGQITEEQIERIADMHHCFVKWEECKLS